MNNETVYKTTKKKFLGQEIRMVQVDKKKEYIICKDMFDVLGLVKDDGGWDKPKKKMLEFLELVHKREDSQELRVLVKQGKIKTAQNVICLNIETAPLVLTQFKPINSNRRTKEQNEQVLDRWAKFMEFVGMLLEYHECHKYIVDDIEKNRLAMNEIIANGGEPAVVYTMINKIMGKLITGEDNFPIKKDELKIYQPQTTIDLLEVRSFVLDKFNTCFAVTGHKDQARDLTLKLAQKKYFD